MLLRGPDGHKRSHVDRRETEVREEDGTDRSAGREGKRERGRLLEVVTGMHRKSRTRVLRPGTSLERRPRRGKEARPPNLDEGRRPKAHVRRTLERTP